MHGDSIYRILYDLGKVRDTRRSRVICKFGLVKGQTSHLTHSPQGAPFWRCEMFKSQVHRKLWLALAGAALLTVAGCSNTATDEANNTAKSAPPAKPAVAAKAAAPRPAAIATPSQPTTMTTLP